MAGICGSCGSIEEVLKGNSKSLKEFTDRTKKLKNPTKSHLSATDLSGILNDLSNRHKDYINHLECALYELSVLYNDQKEKSYTDLTAEERFREMLEHTQAPLSEYKNVELDIKCPGSPLGDLTFAEEFRKELSALICEIYRQYITFAGHKTLSVYKKRFIDSFQIAMSKSWVLWGTIPSKTLYALGNAWYQKDYYRFSYFSLKNAIKNIELDRNGKPVDKDLFIKCLELLAEINMVSGYRKKAIENLEVAINIQSDKMEVQIRLFAKQAEFMLERLPDMLDVRAGNYKSVLDVIEKAENEIPISPADKTILPPTDASMTRDLRIEISKCYAVKGDTLDRLYSENEYWEHLGGKKHLGFDETLPKTQEDCFIAASDLDIPQNVGS